VIHQDGEPTISAGKKSTKKYKRGRQNPKKEYDFHRTNRAGPNKKEG